MKDEPVPSPYAVMEVKMEPSSYSNSAVSLLIVEDDRVTREVLGLMVPKKFPGVSIFFAECGKKGVDLFRERMPQIVITDIQMPEMDGIEMAGAIRAIKADTRFIALTAYGAERYHEALDTAGFAASLSKPIDFPKLFAVIETCIAEIAGTPAEP